MKLFILLLVVSSLIFSCSKEVIIPQYTLSVTSNPIDGGSVSPSSGTFDEGTSVSVTATPSSEYLFSGWTGSVSSNSNPLSLQFDSNKSLTANFEKRTYPLNLTIEGNGTVKEEIVNIANNSTYPSGTNVKLTAQPNDKTIFKEWQGDYSGKDSSIVILINSPKNITAVFESDTDGDGISDSLDEEPNTRKGVPVDSVGRMLNPVYLAENGVTIIAKEWAIVGDSGLINQNYFKIVDKQQLKDLIKLNKNLSFICTSKIKNLDSLFFEYFSNSYSKGLRQSKFDLSNWDVSNVTSMESLFSFCSGCLLDLNLKYWDTSNLKNIKNIFSGAIGNDFGFSSWNTSKIENMEKAFEFSSFPEIDLNNWDVGKVKNMSAMFSRIRGKYPIISNWKVSNVEDMSFMFADQQNNQDIKIELSNWDVSKVSNMKGVFRNSSFNGDISRWDVSSVKNMSEMFRRNFNQENPFDYLKAFNGDISKWDVSNVEDMSFMFEGASFNQDISKWDVSNVKNMKGMFRAVYFFQGIWKKSYFNQDISSWDVSSVEDFSEMFYRVDNIAGTFENWDVSSAINMEGMFMNSRLNPQIQNWNVSNVTNMSKMFGSDGLRENYNSRNSEFNIDLSNWDVSKVLKCEGFSTNISNWKGTLLLPNFTNCTP